MSFNIGVPAGGGGGGADAWSVNGVITDFYNVNANTTSSSASIANFAYGNLFRIDGECTVINIRINIGTLTGTTTARAYGAIYKLNTTTSNFDLIVAAPQEFNYSSTGVLGWNIINFAAPVTLDSGVYVGRFICNEFGGQFKYGNNSSTSMAGYIGTGTNTGTYLGLEQSVSYDFGSTPSTISASSFLRSSSASIKSHKLHYEIKLI